MDDDNKLENALRKLAFFVGCVLLLASMYLSYDGFDQNVNGANSNYTMLATAIGYSLAIAVSILQFILSSRPEGLNITLKVIGVAAYAYSIYTNFLGTQNILLMDKGMASVVALFMDIVPEPMIAWGLGEAIMHDLFKNLGGFMTSPVVKKKGGGGGGGGGESRQKHIPYNQPGRNNQGDRHTQQSQQGQQSQQSRQPFHAVGSSSQSQKGRGRDEARFEAMRAAMRDAKSRGGGDDEGHSGFGDNGN